MARRRAHEQFLRIERSFTAKSAAHARTFHDNILHRLREHMRDDVLHFRWMLRRGTDEDTAVFAHFRPSGVRFEIEMVLAAKRKFA